MSTQIPVNFVQQYKSELRVLYNQMGSRIRGRVREETVTGERSYVERVGHVEAVELVNRHADTQYFDTPHSRRSYPLRDWVQADLIDRADRVRLLIEPANDYARIQAAAHGRRTDRTVIDAALGNADTGKTGGTPVALPAAQTIAWNESEFGATITTNSVRDYGLTVAKLRSAKAKLDDAEAPDDGRYVVCTARQVQDLLGEEEISSADFNTIRALVNGEVNTYLGFTFIRVNSGLLPTYIPTGTEVVRRCFAYHRDAMMLGIGNGGEPVVRITEMPSKNYSVQVWSMMSLGAVRVEDEGVVEIECSESYNPGG